MGANLFHEDGQTDVTKLTVTFRNFTNASKNKNKFEALSKKKVFLW